MIEISLYYLIGSVVILPSVTYYFTNKYYTTKINKMIEENNNRVRLESVDIEDNEDAQIISPSEFTHEDKQSILEEHFKKMIQNT
tara:strand:- start:623 stop:877 length:255 start_codon:yes stop_codon:yes gene_type:complete